MNQKEYAKKKANDHWGYINGLLTIHQEDQDIINLIKFHYLETAVHFFGHGVEWARNHDRARRKLLNEVKKWQTESRKSEIMVK